MIILGVCPDFHSKLKLSSWRRRCIDFASGTESGKGLLDTLNRVIPFQVVLQMINTKILRGDKATYGSPIVQVYTLPEGIISRIEASAVLFEFIWENEDQLGIIMVWPVCIGFRGRVLINEAKISRKGGYLARCVDSANVETALCRRCLRREVNGEGIT